ncbi:TonB-dependent receptor [Novosphingobium sp. 9]|uniref:TonB-dependent receptor n=1 Tax=Novosphingobium sp. 9 TaxID=2025349 RepID=UPI0021B64616|nr:TonB-dependent receptor [Novosphingobium sp. 9]
MTLPHNARFPDRHGVGLAALTLGLFMASPAFAAAADTASPPSTSQTADEAPSNGIAEGADIVVTTTVANEIAPVTASLQTIEPQAIVSRSFIEDSLPATADFNQLALITPSFSTSGGGGGMGISESSGRLRGFQDGEYNITYDGVPFGDSNDYTHHSNTFFPSDTIETVVVNRGPGNADNLGDATFGGTVNLYSRETREDASASLRAQYGSFNTWMLRGLFQTGSIDKLGGTQMVLGGQYVDTDGRLTYSPYHQLNLFGKAVIPIGSSAKLTLLSTYNKNHFNQPDDDGITLAQEAEYGKNYQLNNDPTSTQYYKYNYTNKSTDFEVAKFEADIAPGTKLENRFYTFHYNNSTLSAEDSTGTDKLKTYDSEGNKISGDIPGYTKLNSYRVWGDILKTAVDFGPATLTAGGWLYWENTSRKRYDYDLTAGGPAADAYNYAEDGDPAYIDYDQNSSSNQAQVFAQLEVRPTSTIKITPGFKHMEITREVDALVNQKTQEPAHFSESWSANLPFLTVNWQPTERLAFYAEYAKGFLAPPLDVMQVQDPSLNTVKPQKSTNYQTGFVFHGSHLSVDADIYYIDFSNKLNDMKVDGETIYYNEGGVTYKGAEGQITYAFDKHLAVFANASRNFAKSNETHLQIANAPYMTAAAGVIYKQGPIRASIIDKVVGAQYADDDQPADYRIAGYNTTIISAGYDFGPFAVQGTVSDLFNSRAVTDISINDGPTDDQYKFLAGREWSVSLLAKF